MRTLIGNSTSKSAKSRVAVLTSLDALSDLSRHYDPQLISVAVLTSLDAYSDGRQLSSFTSDISVAVLTSLDAYSDGSQIFARIVFIVAVLTSLDTLSDDRWSPTLNEGDCRSPNFSGHTL